MKLSGPKQILPFCGIFLLLLVVAGVMFLMDAAERRLVHQVALSSQKSKMEKFSALPPNTPLVCSSLYMLLPGMMVRDTKNGKVVKKWKLVRAKVDKDWRWFVLDIEKDKLWSIADCQVLQVHNHREDTK